MSRIRKLTKNTKNSRKQIRKLGILDKAMSSGQFVSIGWVKKSGELTRGTFTRKNYKGTGGINTVSHIPKYKTLWDVNRKGRDGKRGRFCNVSIPDIRAIKFSGEVYEF